VSNAGPLNATEAAAIWGVSRDSVLRAIARGDLPAVRYGRTVRVSRSDLDAFLCRHRVGDQLAARRRRSA